MATTQAMKQQHLTGAFQLLTAGVAEMMNDNVDFWESLLNKNTANHCSSTK